MTLFNTPIITLLLRWLAILVMRILGWRVEGKLPNLPKYVLIGAPHTSNWDFVLFLGTILCLRANVRYMGKAELFRSPFGWFFYWCGGIPVDRSKSTGLVDQMVQAFRESDRFILTIAPEGTRHHVSGWKRGFYHIAQNANVPIVLAKVDGVGKALCVGEVFHLTNDIEADMASIQGAFKGMTGINPKRKQKKKYITLEE